MWSNGKTVKQRFKFVQIEFITKNTCQVAAAAVAVEKCKLINLNKRLAVGDASVNSS